MDRLESFVISSFIAVLVPVCLFVAAWWLSVGIVPERLILACAFAGLCLGVLLDVFFLRIWAARAYSMNVMQLAVLYLYVSVVTYAVCMGVALFNLVPGIVAGIYVGRRLRHSTAGREPAAARDQAARGIKRTALFTASVIACTAAFSSFLALRERTIGAELERMFDLKFTVTRPMIAALVAIGWPVLVLAQYWCTTKAAVIAYGTHEDIEQRCR